VIEELLFSDSGRLTRLLKNELSLVESLGSDVNMRKDPGLVVLSARLRRGVGLESVRDSIYSQLELLKTTPVGRQELRRAVNNLRAQMIYRLDRPARVAGRIGFAHLIGGSYTTMAQLYEQYGQVTPEQILAVAATIFTETNRTLVTLMPKQAS
jgi:predicted Zn-dependent peptidase